jgi:hypothetical protein
VSPSSMDPLRSAQEQRGARAMAVGGLQGAKKRKREHAEGKAKPRKQVKGGGDGAKRKSHSAAGGYTAHGGAGEVVARKKTPVTPKEKRLAAKVSLNCLFVLRSAFVCLSLG